MKLISNIEENNNQSQLDNNFFQFDNLNKILERIEKNYKRLSELETTSYYNYSKIYTPNDSSAKIALLEEKIRAFYARKCISVVSANNNINETTDINNPSTISSESKEAYLLRQKAELLRKLEETELTIKMLTNERW
ncbi:MAG: hypothetical protein ACPL2D_06855 [Ignavibacteria bacterium]